MKPADVATRQDLAACLNQLRLGAGWEYQKIDQQRKLDPASVPMARSTVHDLCAGNIDPTREKVATFLAMCGLTGAAAQPYLHAWDRIYDRPDGRGPSARRVRDWDPLLLGVRQPIEVPGAEAALPRYFGRDADDELRTLLLGNGRRFVLLVGHSSVGKTRTAYEALMAAVPHWWLLYPHSRAEFESIAADSGRNTVVWLDEIQRVLGNGLTEGIVRALLTARHPVLLIGTVWPGPYRTLTTPALDDAPPDGRDGQRKVLQLATIRTLDKDLSAAESDRAMTAAATDPRLAVACGSQYGLIPALSAVPALLDHWTNAPDNLCRSIILAGVDAVRLGAQAPLAEDLLRDAVVGYLTPAERARAVAKEWERALAYAIVQLDGAASVLEPVGMRLGVTDGYRVADFLVEHIGRSRAATVPPASAWEAYCRHVSAGSDLLALGTAAEQRLLLGHAERLYRAAGTADAYGNLGYVLLRQNRINEAEEAWKEAVRLDPTEYESLVEDLDSMGWPAIVESLLRVAVASGEPFALYQLTGRLDERGDTDRADELWRDAAEAGVPGARTQVALRRCGHASSEAAEVWRAALRDGEPDARRYLARVLADEGRIGEVERLWRRGLEVGDPAARPALADLLTQQDRQDELEALWRVGVANGEPGAWAALVNAFREFDRPAEAERAWREATAAGHPMDRLDLAGLLVEREKLTEAETILRELAKTSRPAADDLAELLERQGRTDAVERLWRNRLAGGDLDATEPLCDLLEEQDRTDELEQLLRADVEQRGRHLDRLLNLLTGQHQDGEIENLLRQHAVRGDGLARSRLIRWLEQSSRPDDAERVFRAAVAAGQEEHLDFAHFLKRQGRLPEAEHAFRTAVSSGEYAAWWGLIRLLQETGRLQEADRLMRHGMNPDG